MALIKCPECGQPVSDQAEVCIHCGFPIKKYRDGQISINTEDANHEHNLEDGDSLSYEDKIKRDVADVKTLQEDEIVEQIELTDRTHSNSNGNNHIKVNRNIVIIAIVAVACVCIIFYLFTGISTSGRNLKNKLVGSTWFPLEGTALDQISFYNSKIKYSSYDHDSDSLKEIGSYKWKVVDDETIQIKLHGSQYETFTILFDNENLFSIFPAITNNKNGQTWLKLID